MEGMKRYIGTYTIRAKPMSRGEYNTLRGWSGGPPDDSPGYLTQFDGEKHPDWMRADTFEREYCPADKMNFGDALEALKRGKRVAREGWNSTQFWMLLEKREEQELQYFVIESRYGAETLWLTTRADLLACDWYVVE
jgi:hypothetical protein